MPYKDKEKLKSYKAAYRADHIEYFKAHSAAYRMANPENVKAYQSAYRSVRKFFRALAMVDAVTQKTA
jgi:hypothetical protein